MDLPIKVEGIMYATRNGKYKFLIIRRVPEDGGFWQPFTGTVEDGERIEDCLTRELKEETGIDKPIKVTERIWNFDWKNKRDETIIEFVYGVEISPTSKIVLDPKEHSEYKWCSFEEAISLLEKENNKKAFNFFKDKIINNKN